MGKKNKVNDFVYIIGLAIVGGFIGSFTNDSTTQKAVGVLVFGFIGCFIGLIVAQNK